MTAENEHKLSIRLLSNVALGRGSQISLDIVKKQIILFSNFFILYSIMGIPARSFAPYHLTKNIVQSNPQKNPLNSLDIVLGRNYKLNPSNNGQNFSN